VSTRFVSLPAGRPLRINVRGELPDRHASIQAEWSAACKKNPRLFDGPILAVTAMDSAAGVIDARPERFAHVVCTRPRRAIPTTILSVTGVIEAMHKGSRCVLLARRGAQTRSYPGQWEFAPAGGLHPVEAPAVLTIQHVLDTLAAEFAEEVGIAAKLQHPRPIGLIADASASSVDIVVRASVDAAESEFRIAGDHAWEITEARWVPTEALPSFLASARGGVIEPTITIARRLGWVP